ncbi:magnesium transporter MgtE N-terminal domain-containing protein [Dactylosporangium sp. NPDC048998]|uniref:magnesium transporter MgtE N-terminal domain-containing protein n=1 Tax=Dactylosporangium sp. NPDC048998 TaxID=3363976 RepID=UPI00371C0E32
MNSAATTPFATGPARAPRLMLSRLLKTAAIDARGQRLGHLVDVIVRLPADGGYPPVTGLVAELGRRQVFIPAEVVRAWQPDRVELASARVDLRAFQRREGEVLLRADVLGHRLLDTANARLVHAHDVELTAGPAGGWVLSGVDVHRLRWLHRPGHHPHHPFRDWLAFEPLIGHQPSLRVRHPLARLRRLKPAELADLLEDASAPEQREILTQVHADPELEADVFEELDDDQQSHLLADRSDAEVADVIAHMRADEAADAIAGLPHERRLPVLGLLPDQHRVKVTTLLGYHNATAGGLMGVDALALPGHTTVHEALQAVHQATTTQPEALATVYTLTPDGRLAGAIGLVALLQADPDATLHTTADPDPVHVPAHADQIEIATLMADYNLPTLPVVDNDHHLLGVITIDDVLDETIPANWRRREPAPHHHGAGAAA